MNNKVNVAVLGSTGFVGLELIKILLNHPNVNINFIGSENHYNKNISDFNKGIQSSNLPVIKKNEEFEELKSDVVFLCLPHGISHFYVKKYIDKLTIIDLSADFRLDSNEVYSLNYNNSHSCPELLSSFVYGLCELNIQNIKNSKNIAVPGCYPTSILLPLIPLLKKNLIIENNIIIDSKSGFSGAGKKFDISNIKNHNDFNFYNYNTNQHRHICEISQELRKNTKEDIYFSFNPHILPNYRGMMSTIYCDLKKNASFEDIENTLLNFSRNLKFVKLIRDNKKFDFFEIQNTNNCMIKVLKHNQNKSIIIISLIDNLIKGAAGQAIQNFNICFNFAEELGIPI